MNYLDIVLGILLILGAIQGFRKGFISEVAGLAALILGVWGAIHFSYLTSGYIKETFDYHPEHIGLISFLVTFVLIVILVHIIGKVVENILSVVALGFLNKLAGILFGAIKAALILSVLLLILDEFDPNSTVISEKTKEESQIYEPVKSLVPTILPFLNFWDIDSSPFKKEKDPQKEDETGKAV